MASKQASKHCFQNPDEFDLCMPKKHSTHNTLASSAGERSSTHDTREFQEFI
eukprot:m.152553 g.152553  ORF g.152553 m.152553 type:complete len:52 (+) comp14261_c0_seq1:80-235(+)